MLKGALHIHSTYSDGEFTLPGLRSVLSSAGCAFACMADHAESFEEGKLKTYARECQSLSDESFCFIPGLEFECEERMHILGYGVVSLPNSHDPQEVIHYIKSQGGIAVIAHPTEKSFPKIESFKVLPDGIEIWNSKYDGRYALRPATVQLLHRLQQRKPEMLAFFGQDLHWRRQYRGLLNLVQCRSTTREEILTALAQGEFAAIKGNLNLPSTGEISEVLLRDFAVLHARSSSLRKGLMRAKRLLDRLGLGVPAKVKAQVRRIF